MSDGFYGPVEERYSFGNTVRISYGIVFYANSEPGEPTVILASVHDICDDRGRIFKLVDTCNRLKLSPLHLWDVVEDFLAG